MENRKSIHVRSQVYPDSVAFLSHLDAWILCVHSFFIINLFPRLYISPFLNVTKGGDNLNHTISRLIQLYKEGSEPAAEQILLQLTPLVKHYAQKSFFLEFDDALQEYSIAVFEAILKIRSHTNDGQCLKYISTCVRNKYVSLCKSYYAKSQPAYLELVTEELSDHSSLSDYENRIFFSDLMKFIHQIPSKQKQKIAISILVHEKSDSETAAALQVSKQYVNRIRRWLYQEILDYL